MPCSCSCAMHLVWLDVLKWRQPVDVLKWWQPTENVASGALLLDRIVDTEAYFQAFQIGCVDWMWTELLTALQFIMTEASA